MAVRFFPDHKVVRGERGAPSSRAAMAAASSGQHGQGSGSGSSSGSSPNASRRGKRSKASTSDEAASSSAWNKLERVLEAEEEVEVSCWLPDSIAVVLGRPRPVGIKQINECVPMADGMFTQPPTGRRPQVVSFFAHKGGVGKTTLAGCVAWELAAMGKRVLLVDGDPQCNLSEWLVPNSRTRH